MHNDKSFGMKVTAVIIIFLIFISGCRAIDKGTNFRTEIGTVSDKGVKRNGDTDKYLVYTVGEDGEIHIYEITDSLVAFRFNSSDVYAGIEIGKTYEFSVAGERNAFLSWYPNIYSYTEVFADDKGNNKTCPKVKWEAYTEIWE